MSEREDTADIWRRLGPFWDAYTGPEGRPFHRQVLNPVTESLLDLRAGDKVLDIACGNGHLSRRMARLGAHVVAFDVSEPLIRRALAHTDPGASIEYLVRDATDREALLSLGVAQFDAAVANMALMDIPGLDPLIEALSRLLKPSGRFVVSVLHPCFGYTLDEWRAPVAKPGNRLLGRAASVIPGVLRRRASRAREALRLARQQLHYLEARPRLGYGIEGQPVAHWYFHRPLGELLRPALARGFVLDRLVEPARPGQPGRAGVLVMRLRAPASPEPVTGPPAPFGR